MSTPGNRVKGEDLAPFYVLKVEGTKLEADITSFITNVEYEHSTKLVDLMQITAKNPGFIFTNDPEKNAPDWGAHKVFQPGNEIDLWMGYGPLSAAYYQGRSIVARHLPLFPSDGMPSLQIKGYDGAFRMMDQSEDITVGKTPKKTKKKQDSSGDKFVQMTHSQMVEIKAAKYGYHPNVHQTSKVDTIIQKKGMTDYQFVSGLAAVNDMDFWVDYNIVQKKWVLNFQPPQDSRPKYELVYGKGNLTTLLWCEPQYGLKDQATEIKVMYFSKQSGRWEFITVEEEKEGPSPFYQKGASPATRRSPRARKKGVKKAKEQREILNEEIKSVTRLRLAAAGHSIDIIPDKQFKDAAEALKFATRWFRARKEHFIILRGGCAGIEDMKSRQVHRLVNLGHRLSGDYRFTSARHRQSSEGGYDIEFIANKVMEGSV
jgi:phage protein D